MNRLSIEDLQEQLREIAVMDYTECAEALNAMPRVTLPSGLRAPTLRRLLAYETQAQVLGALGRKEQQALKSLVGSKAGVADGPQYASPGTHFVRDWNGQTYRVEVTQEGYVLQGEVYRSLSAVAKRIAGTAWSGPRFFGLTSKRSG